jgi:hypothetical protein
MHTLRIKIRIAHGTVSAQRLLPLGTNADVQRLFVHAELKLRLIQAHLQQDVDQINPDVPCPCALAHSDFSYGSPAMYDLPVRMLVTKYTAEL